ncbi:MAG: helix-turn-helix transcriptional regulator [Bacteroidales bacterium]|nr:helix-turn-helix transcriptional regulator [Bacteroidales bacterium]
MTRHVVIMVYALAATLFAPVLALPIASLMLLIDEAVDLKLEVLALFSVLGMLPCIIFAAFPSCSSVTAVITFLLLPNATLAYRCWAYGRVAVHVNDLLKGMSVYGLLLERRRGLLLNAHNLICLYSAVVMTVFDGKANWLPAGGLWLLYFGYVTFMSVYNRPYVLSRRMVKQLMKELSESELNEIHADICYAGIMARVKQALWVDKRFLDTDFKLSNLAAEVYANKQYVSKAIAAYTGKSLPMYVQHCRIIYAMKLMRSKPGLSDSELARIVGFRRPGMFTSAFLYHTEMTTDEWRRIMFLPESASLPESRMMV